MTKSVNRLMKWFADPDPMLGIETPALDGQVKQLASYFDNWLPEGPEKTVAIRHLIDARDAARRAMIEASPFPPGYGKARHTFDPDEPPVAFTAGSLGPPQDTYGYDHGPDGDYNAVRIHHADGRVETLTGNWEIEQLERDGAPPGAKLEVIEAGRCQPPDQELKAVHINHPDGSSTTLIDTDQIREIRTALREWDRSIFDAHELPPPLREKYTPVAYVKPGPDPSETEKS